jgi:hypothetical protein
LLSSLELAAEPGAWTEAGFTVDAGAVTVGGVRIELRGPAAGRRITGWSVHGLASTDLDGLPTEVAAEPPSGEDRSASTHPNGVVALDHVVAFSPSLERTVAALKAAGLDLRRIREGPTAAGAQRQAFFRLGQPILEVIEHPPGTAAAEDREAPARFWGLAFVVADLAESARALGPRLGEVRDAIQPGRRIATVRREAGLGLPVALMTAVA